MNYFESVSQAVDYIEDRLLQKIAIEEIAERVGYSPFHFHRIFLALTRTTVSEYIRSRRLTHAAYELFHTDQRIMDIAVKHRFQSQEAFTRAFQNLFSITPGQFRKQTDMKNTLFRAMEKSALDEKRLRHLHAGVSREPEIVKTGERYLVGLEEQGLDSRKIGALWGRFRQRLGEIRSRRGPGDVFYALIELTGQRWEVAYTACVEAEEAGPLPEGMVGKRLASATYAVFTHRGPLARLPETFQYIYLAWLPQSGWQRGHEPEFARYDPRYRGPNSEGSELDLYIPVRSGADSGRGQERKDEKNEQIRTD